MLIRANACLHIQSRIASIDNDIFLFTKAPTENKRQHAEKEYALKSN